MSKAIHTYLPDRSGPILKPQVHVQRSMRDWPPFYWISLENMAIAATEYQKQIIDQINGHGNIIWSRGSYLTTGHFMAIKAKFQMIFEGEAKHFTFLAQFNRRFSFKRCTSTVVMRRLLFSLCTWKAKLLNEKFDILHFEYLTTVPQVFRLFCQYIESESLKERNLFTMEMSW